MQVGKALKRFGCICGVKRSNDESCRSRHCSLWCPEMATKWPIEILALKLRVMAVAPTQ